MNTEYTELAAELMLLQKEAQKAFSSSKAQQPNSSYLAKLQEATKKCLDSSDTEVHKALVRCYLPYMEKVATQYILPNRYLHDINIFVKIIVGTDLVSYVTDELAASNTLAGICMLRGFLAQETKWSHAKSCNITDVLKKWLGSSPEADKLVGAQAVSDFLYGSGAWLLFQSEADNDFERIRVVLKQGLPITPRTSQFDNGGNGEEFDLPFDLS